MGKIHFKKCHVYYGRNEFKDVSCYVKRTTNETEKDLMSKETWLNHVDCLKTTFLEKKI